MTLYNSRLAQLEGLTRELYSPHTGVGFGVIASSRQADFDLSELKAYYKFDEASGDIINQAGAVGSVDSLGTGADLQVTGATHGATGIIDDALSYDGVNDKTVAGTSLSQWNFLHEAGAAWSMVMWFKLGATEQNNTGIWQTSTGISDDGIVLAFRTGTSANKFDIRLLVINNAVIDINTTIADVGDDDTDFHMLGVRWDEDGGSNNLKMTFDGGAFLEATTATTTASGNAQIAGEWMVDGGPNFTNTLQDETSWWNRLLSLEEFQTLYNSGAAFAL